MGKNRDRLTIIADILETANGGTTKTNIMTSTGISWKLLGKYLDIVTSVGFVLVMNYKYNLTESGRKFLEKYKKFEEHHKDAQKLLETLIDERKRLTESCEKLE